MEILLGWWPVAVMAVDWVAVAIGWRRLEYVAKPGAMVALLAWVWLNAGAGVATTFLALFVLGVVFSLAGDVLLMLPARFFTIGLVSFLLAHVAYIAGFLVGPVVGMLGGSVDRASYFPWRLAALPTMALLAAPIIFGAAWLGRRVTQALESSGQSKLIVPVVAYACIITVMVVSALTTLVRPDWPASAAGLVFVGAELFFVSDVLLAWDRFVRPVRNSRLLVNIVYHVGQMSIVAGAVQDLLHRRLL